jgi:hypothetical protein
MRIHFIIILCLFNMARAEESKEPRKPEGLLTIGIGSGYFGPTIYSGITYIVNDNVIALRYCRADELRFNVDGQYDEPALRCKEYGVLYGRAFRKEILEISVCAGIAYVDGIDRGLMIENKQFVPIQISTIGLPFEARIRFDFGVINLGGAWYGDINDKRSSTGAMLELSLKVFGY